MFRRSCHTLAVGAGSATRARAAGSYSAPFRRDGINPEDVPKPGSPEAAAAADAARNVDPNLVDSLTRDAETRSPLKVQWWMKDRWQSRFDRPNEENMAKAKEKTFYYPMEPDAANTSTLPPVYYYTNYVKDTVMNRRTAYVCVFFVASLFAWLIYGNYVFWSQAPRAAHKADTTWERNSILYRS